MGVGQSTFQTFVLPAPLGRPILTPSPGGIGCVSPNDQGLEEEGCWGKGFLGLVFFFLPFPFPFHYPVWQYLGSASPDRSMAVFVNSNWVKRCFVSELSLFLYLFFCRRAAPVWRCGCRRRKCLPWSAGSPQGHTAPYRHQNMSSMSIYHNQHQGVAFLSNFLSPKGESDLKLIVLFGSKYFHSAFPLNWNGMNFFPFFIFFLNLSFSLCSIVTCSLLEAFSSLVSYYMQLTFPCSAWHCNSLTRYHVWQLHVQDKRDGTSKCLLLNFPAMQSQFSCFTLLALMIM